MADTADGALSESDASTVEPGSPNLSPTSTAVESDMQMAHLERIGSYNEKKKWLRAKTSEYVDRVATRTYTFRTNYKAILWSLLLMLSVILVGYSQNLVVSLLAQPQFQERFSSQEDDFGSVWMLAVQMCSVGSSMIGGMMVGWLSSQFPVRFIMASALACFLACTFINFWAPSMSFFLLGTLLQGLCCGGFGTLASTYISDACTSTISHVMTGMISCCWIIGQLTSYGVLWLMVNVQGVRAYRIPMALQWVIPLPVIIGCFLAPSSPWWHVRRGNTSEALKQLHRLTSSSSHQQRSLFGTDNPTEPAVLRLAEIQRVVDIEREQEVADISFRECFRGSNLRRTEIAVMVNVGQIIVGFAIASQLLNFMRLAGLQSGDSIKMAFSLLFGWSFLYGATVGPSTNTIVCDVSSAALRTKTLALSRMANDMANLIQAAAGPYMLGQDMGNMQGLTAFPAVGLITVWLVWAMMRLPEMKDIPQAILDILFERRVPAHRFQREAKRLEIMDAQALDGQVDGARGVVVDTGAADTAAGAPAVVVAEAGFVDGEYIA
ncbi:hypothetical protein SEUCBS139899_004786 [Sporothrix eucalyptigena]